MSQLLIEGAIVLALLVVTFFTGVQWESGRVVKKEAVVAQQVAKVEAKQQEVVAQAAAVNDVQQEHIRTVFKDREVIRTVEVPHEVIVHEDAGCTVPNRFVGLWNTANRAVMPELPGESAERPSGIVLSDITAEHDRELAACHANTEQLRQLIAAVKNQSRISSGGTAPAEGGPVPKE